MKRVSFAALMVLAMLGCAGSPEARDKPAPALKPIDRVREGIVTLSGDLKNTLASAQEMTAGDASQVRSKRSAYSQDLKATEQSFQNLRADSQELKQRAAEYLVLWGGQTISVGNDVAIRDDPRHTAGKDKYDQLVSELVAARDALTPLWTELKAIENRANGQLQEADLSAMRARVQAAQTSSAGAIAHLDRAVATLDELKTMVNANKRPQ